MVGVSVWIDVLMLLLGLSVWGLSDGSRELRSVRCVSTVLVCVCALKLWRRPLALLLLFPLYFVCVATALFLGSSHSAFSAFVIVVGVGQMVVLVVGLS